MTLLPYPTQYEYEERALISEDAFLPIMRQLESMVTHTSLDNKRSYFFVLPDVNVSIAESATKTVIKYKGGQLGLGNGFEEIEVAIARESSTDAIKLLGALLKTEPQFSEQFSINYFLPGSIEVALKYTHTWGFHLEIEKTYDSTQDAEHAQQLAKDELAELATNLAVSFITDEAMARYKAAWVAGEQFGAYSPDEFRAKFGNLFAEVDEK